MGLNTTPKANRLHIIILGKRNVGKSSLLNSLSGQEVAISSDVPGTTTDPVEKAMEIHGIGPVMFIDTAGFDDEGNLGQQRVRKTMAAIDKADIALMVYGDDDNADNMEILDLLDEKNVPVIHVLNKSDKIDYSEIKKIYENAIEYDAINDKGREEIISAIKLIAGEDKENYILGNLVDKGDVVMLVMPQDKEAPKGRLILPQVQVIRELIDRGVVPICVTDRNFTEGINKLSQLPDLIVTDSQVFKDVYEKKPDGVLLTSFSVLFAAHKGDVRYFVESADVIDRIDKNAKILIAEACSHAPIDEDIGTVKIPMMLKKKIGEDIQIDHVSGSDFPEDLRRYDLIIHCGSCMFNKKHTMARVKRAKEQNVPMSNYGIIIAKLSGILKNVVIPD